MRSLWQGHAGEIPHAVSGIRVVVEVRLLVRRPNRYPVARQIMGRRWLAGAGTRQQRGGEQYCGAAGAGVRRLCAARGNASRHQHHHPPAAAADAACIRARTHKHKLPRINTSRSPRI